MTLPLVLAPNAELVAVAYLRGILTPYGVGVGTTLPGPSEATGVLSWGGPAGGFITVGSITGSVNSDVPVRTSMVSLDAYATRPGGNKPPWGHAFAIAETVIRAVYDTATHETQLPVTLPAGYPAARVSGFVALGEPSRRLSDPANYARVGFDVAISWHPL